MTDKTASLTDQQLLLTGKRVHQENRDTGGMFDAQLLVVVDETPGVEKPYLAVVTTGWGGGAGRRYATEEEAKANLERLFQRVYG